MLHSKEKAGQYVLLYFLLPAVGLEPTRGYPQQILSLHRLPFRHAGIFAWLITKQIDIIIPDLEMPVLFPFFQLADLRNRHMQYIQQ